MRKAAAVKITNVYEGTVPISSSIRNAWIDFRSMDCSIVAIESDVIRDGKPVVGYGFNSNGRYSAGEILRRRVLPRLLHAEPDGLLGERGELDPAKAWDIMMRNEKPGGHGERSVAVGVVDMALFDLASKIADKPLYRYLSERYGDGRPDDSVFVYAAGGYYAPGKTLADLQDEMRGFLDLGYDVVKMKIGDPLDYHLNATVAEHYAGPIATGENLFSLQDARNLIRYGGLRPDRDTLQVDPALSYGLVEYLRIQDMLRQHGWSSRRCVPHGGHQFSLHLAAALKLGGNESYPGEFQPTGGFADDAVVEKSRVGLTDIPGIGFEGKATFHKVLRDLHT